MTNKITTQSNGIGEEERAAIESALFAYYSGQAHTIVEAFTDTRGTGVGTYYRLRKEFPDEMLGVQKLARARAREFIAGQRQALDAEAIQASKEMQKRARDGLLQSLDCLIAIASGETRTIDLDGTDKDGSPKVKQIVSYPRDVVGAAKILQEIARGGVLPEKALVLPPDYAHTEEQREPMIPVLGIGADFTRVTATAVDGTQYTAEVKPGVVVDVTAEEIDDE